MTKGASQMEHTDMSAWGAMQPYEKERFGEVIMDPEERKRWAAAFMLGGLPYMWTKLAPVPRLLFLDRLELRQGDRVLLIGEAIDGVGIDREIRERVGPNGDVVVIDFMNKVRDIAMGGERPQWEWDYTREFQDEHFDAIGVFQGVAHSANWRVTAEELLRTLKAGRMIVLGEIVFGPPLARVVRQDVHVNYLFAKVWEVLTPGEDFEDQVYWSPEDLDAAFKDQVVNAQSFVWHGVEMFWGRKAAA
jgi:hypothetical protein